MRLPQLPWPFRKKKSYESLEDALHDLNLPLGTELPLSAELTGSVSHAFGIDYLSGWVRFVRSSSNGRLEAVCEIVIGMDFNVKVGAPYRVIRSESTHVEALATTKFTNLKRIKLRKTVGYFENPDYFKDRKVPVQEIEPLISALPARYYLQELRKRIAPEALKHFTTQIAELKRLEAIIGQYEQFVPT